LPELFATNGFLTITIYAEAALKLLPLHTIRPADLCDKTGA